MATSYAQGMPSSSSSSQRGVAMVLALVSAVVLSPLYVDRTNDHRNFRSYDTKWSSGFVLPVVLAGLIVAIKTTSTAASGYNRGARRTSVLNDASSEPSSHVLKIGSSSWGLAGILVMLMFIMSWQSSLQHFLWR